MPNNTDASLAGVTAEINWAMAQKDIDRTAYLDAVEELIDSAREDLAIEAIDDDE